MSRISLCVIAKDEERFLPGCLASVADAVDERVVLDTGSTDRTVALARAAGATVAHAPWTGDFSAARNAALAAATGDWVLVLDADERLAPGAGAALRAAVAEGGFHCGMLPLHNASSLDAPPAAVLSGAARRGEPMLLPRLLCVDEALAWRGAVHESVGHWVADGRTARAVDAPIVHLGDVPEVREGRGKDARNRALLEAACAAHPGDPVARTYLARELLRAGEAERARAESAAAWAALQEAWRGTGPRPEPSATVNVHAFLLLGAGQPEAALSVLDAAASMVGPHPNLALLRAAALDELEAPAPGALRAALRGLAAARAARGRAWAAELNPGATSWAAATLTGQLQLRLRRPKQAFEAFRAALDDKPDHLPAALGALEARIGLGDAAGALRGVEPLLSVAGADGWALAAMATAALGDRQTAAALLGKTRGQPWTSTARARRAAVFARGA